MSQRFRITRNYYCENENIYDKSSVTISSGLTILIGCNGAGKSTMLRQMRDQCEKNKLPLLFYDGYQSGGKESISLAGYLGNYDFVARGAMSSEGERINNDIVELAKKIGATVRSASGSDKVFILIDGIDSGLSIDYVLELKKDLFNLIIKDCENSGMEAYIVVSANEYEMARGEQCLDVSSCEYVKVNSYDDYRRIIIETRKKKNKRYGHDDFEWG